MKPIDDLDETLIVQMNVISSVLKCVLTSLNLMNKESKMLLNNNLNSLKIIAKGLVPIIEPEVNINAKDKSEIEKVLKAEIKKV